MIVIEIILMVVCWQYCKLVCKRCSYAIATDINMRPYVICYSVQVNVKPYTQLQIEDCEIDKKLWRIALLQINQIHQNFYHQHVSSHSI